MHIQILFEFKFVNQFHQFHFQIDELWLIIQNWFLFKFFSNFKWFRSRKKRTKSLLSKLVRSKSSTFSTHILNKIQLVQWMQIEKLERKKVLVLSNFMRKLEPTFSGQFQTIRVGSNIRLFRIEFLLFFKNINKN